VIECRIQSLDFTEGGIRFAVQGGRRAAGFAIVAMVWSFTGNKYESGKSGDNEKIQFH